MNDFLHLCRDSIPTVNLVDKAIAGAVNEQTARASECFRCEELCFCIWIARVNKSGGMDLHLVQITQRCRVR